MSCLAWNPADRYIWPGPWAAQHIALQAASRCQGPAPVRQPQRGRAASGPRGAGAGVAKARRRQGAKAPRRQGAKTRTQLRAPVRRARARDASGTGTETNDLRASTRPMRGERLRRSSNCPDSRAPSAPARALQLGRAAAAASGGPEPDLGRGPSPPPQVPPRRVLARA